MWLWSWLDSLLNYLGLAQRSGRLVFLGLDNAGKTTLLQMLSHGRVSASLPTGRPTEERLALGGLRLTAFDLGGHLQARRVWKDYFPAVDGLVFVVDAAHPQRFEEARHELQGLLAEQQVAGIPLMVLGNKIDKPSAVGEAELRRALSLRGTTSGKGKAPEGVRPLELFMASVQKGQGYGEAFRWLAQHLH